MSAVQTKSGNMATTTEESISYPSPFVRPHPLVWTFTLSLNILYLLVLVLFLTYYPLDTARQHVMKYIDSSLGKPLEERSYAEDCSFGLKIIWEAVDVFCLAHALGWFGKALILRDYWFCWILSIAFELAEYSLEHQLANFKECWWDHWILDVLICNWLGTWLGMKTCQYLMVKPYEWRGTQPQATTRRGQLKRRASHALGKLRPYDFTRFTWRPFSSLKSYICTVGLLAGFLVAELNPFYLKALLWIPPSHPLVILRLVFIFLWGLPTVRELYDIVDDRIPRTLPIHLLTLLLTLLLELLLIAKWGWIERTEYPTPFPLSIKLAWGIGAVMVAAYGGVVWLRTRTRDIVGGKRRKG